jgi:CheY-like chemotaxis protein
VDDVVDRGAGGFRSAADQRQQPLVRVRLAEQIDRFLGEDLTSELTAVGLGQVVPKAGEDDAVQAPILRRPKRRCAATDEISMRPRLLSGSARARRAFDVYLPASDEPLAAIDGPAEPVAATVAARVLVVEDEEVVCRLIAESLTSAGYDVTATADPRAALELAREQRFHVLVTDVAMPHMDGPEVARALLSRRPDLRVLYTSGYGAAAPAGLVGADAAFLAKPFALFELQDRVASLLDELAA